jgi:hypothetical protein
MARKIRNGPTPHPITLIENLVLSSKSTTYWELPKKKKQTPLSYQGWRKRKKRCNFKRTKQMKCKINFLAFLGLVC